VTQLQTLNVEHEELMTRADELAAPITGLPAENGQAPCALEMVVRAAQQLGLSADNMRIYLTTGERERRRLAQSLRNAAEAYAQTDKGAAEAVTNGTSVSAAMPAPADRDVEPAMLTGTVSLMAAEPIPYYPVRQAAEELARGDQGTSFLSFADAWTTHQRTLLEASYRFRPFNDWYSATSLVVEQNFDQHRQWLDQMARLCGQLATQARAVVSAHRWAVKEHPTAWQIQQIDGRWMKYQGTRGWSEIKPQLLAYYAQYQEKSEMVLAEYEKRAALPLPPVSPPKPPTAYQIDPPRAGTKPGPGPGSGLGPGPESGREQLPLPDGGLPSLPTGMPGLPFAGQPSMPTDSTLNEAFSKDFKDVKGPRGLAAAAALKPASVGGGSAGVPSVASKPPLQPWLDSEAVSRPAGAASGGAGLKIPAAYAALGGGGGMGMPMGGPGGQGQDARKGKRARQEDGAVYTEDRAWTEGVIGRQRS